MIHSNQAAFNATLEYLPYPKSGGSRIEVSESLSPNPTPVGRRLSTLHCAALFGPVPLTVAVAK
jgi:hypothetical protein